MSGKSKNTSKKGEGSRVVAVNRRARHEYTVLETLDAGMVLTGTEIKSIRKGKVSIAEAYAKVQHDEVYLYGSQISPYEQGNIHNHAQDRTRKLLLHRKEINRLIGKVKEQGLTLIPLKMYFSGPWIKLEIGLCKGKKLHDKRETLKARQTKREIDRAMKQ